MVLGSLPLVICIFEEYCSSLECWCGGVGCGGVGCGGVECGGVECGFVVVL